MDNSKKMAQVMAEIEERDRDGLPIRELCVEAIGYLEEARKEFLRHAQEAGYELTSPRVGEIEVQQYSAMRQLAERAGIKVAKVLTHDDISAGIGADINDRRGLAGCVPLYKILGAASEEGKSLEELVEIAERYNKNVATLAVAMKSCSHPQNGAVITDLPAGIMEIGMGQHGEGGGGQKPLVSADDTAAEMVDLLCRQLQPQSGDKMMLIINGVGATTHMELNIVFRKAYKELEARGLKVVVSRIQELLTVQEQAGFQMIMARLDNDHIDYLKNKPSNAPYWTVIGK